MNISTATGDKGKYIEERYHFNKACLIGSLDIVGPKLLLEVSNRNFGYLTPNPWVREPNL